jgi:hypothetical protein
MENIDWLKQEKPQIIRFRDRIIYKKKGVYHNINGPSIKSLKDSSQDQFYIDGELLEYNEWNKKSTVLKRRRKIKKLEKMENKSI